MDHDRCTVDPALRRKVYERFYQLPARGIMNGDLERLVFLPPHVPVEELLDVFVEADHAWILAGGPGARRRVESILLRRDLLRALEPTHASYTRFSTARFRSLAHGSADCICCFHEGRVLHTVTPETTCREALRLMESKGASYLAVFEGGEMLGEIGATDLLRSLAAAYRAEGVLT